MRTPLLIDVPKTGLSRRQKLAAWKREHGIEMLHSAFRREEFPWLAAHLPSARRLGYGVTADSDLFDCFSKVGRLMDEAGIAAYGRTERDAIDEVCRNCGIPLPQ